MQRLEVRGAVRPIYGSLGVKRLRYVTPRALVVEEHIFNLMFIGPRVIVIVEE